MKKAARFSFKMVGIKSGTELYFKKDENIKCEVVDNNKVIYEGKKMSLSVAALAALKRTGHLWKSAQGAAYWMYEGETLKDIREKIESE